MLIILSPAKNMGMSPKSKIPAGTTPGFKAEAEYLVSKLQSYSREQLQLLLQISNKLTDTNYERYQQFNDPSTPSIPAILAYTGNVFQHIRPETFTGEDYRYAQDRLRIISTLYGLLRPLDLIHAYRLIYQVRIQGIKEKDLYEYWQPRLTKPLLKDIKNSGNILINLASLDILGALQMEKIEKEVRVITPEFKEFRKGKHETIRTYAKMARGEMTRYILQNRIEEPEQIKKFTWEDFSFKEELSDESHYIFTK